MKALVIGSSGLVGTRLCEYLSREGDTVIPFDVKIASTQDAAIAKLPLEEADVVYFLAWDVGGSKYLYRSDSQTRQLIHNTALLANVMPQLEAAKKPFLFVSTQLAEHCDTAYSVTKRLGEVWTKSIGGIVVRLWNIYGRIHNISERSHVIPDFVIQALKDKEIRMMTNGLEERQFIFIDDVCSAFHAAMLYGESGNVYDASSHVWKKVLDVADIIAAETGATIVQGEKAGSKFATVQKDAVPNWTPRVSLELGLKKTIESAKELLCNQNST